MLNPTCLSLNITEEKISLFKDNFKYLNFEDISSIKHFLDEENAALEIIRCLLKRSRFLHVLSVSILASEVALELNYDVSSYLLAGLFHDICKDLPISSQYEIACSNPYYHKDIPDFAIHAFSSSVLTRNIIDIDDNIFDAITFHCTGRSNMSIFSQIIYTADKCEPLRDFPTKKIREILFNNPHLAFISVIKEQEEYLKSENINYLNNKYTIDMYNQYRGEFQ